MRAFDIHAPLPAAGVVLLLMNVVTIFPFWPGNVGLVQVAIASALVGYGVEVRRRRRVRLRAAGDRGVGRHRRRAPVPRARGSVAGDAARDADGVEGGGSGGDGGGGGAGLAARARRRLRLVRALVAPASLKGVLAARDAAAELAAGFREAGAEADECPVADGGEGTADALRAALGGEWREAAVADPLGRPVAARWLELPDGSAVVEAAAAIGLGLVAMAERDPLRASSRGLGELIAATGGRRLLVCLGGTATVDGGRGLREVVRSLPAGDARRVRRCVAAARRGAAVRAAEGRRRRGGRRARAAARGRRRARAVRGAAGRGRGRRARCRVRVARRGARAGRGACPRCGRFRRAARRRRPRRHRRGHASTGRRAEGKAPAEVARRCSCARRRVRRLRRRRRGAVPRRRDDRALRRSGAGARAISAELGLRLGTRLLDAAG